MFRYGATALYALTGDSTGQNLPSLASPESWQFERPTTLQLDKGSPKHELIKATLVAIRKNGFYLTHAALHVLPIDLGAPDITAPAVRDSAFGADADPAVGPKRPQESLQDGSAIRTKPVARRNLPATRGSNL